MSTISNEQLNEWVDTLAESITKVGKEYTLVVSRNCNLLTLVRWKTTAFNREYLEPDDTPYNEDDDPDELISVELYGMTIEKLSEIERQFIAAVNSIDFACQV